jgi:hypothetical protein
MRICGVCLDSDGATVVIVDTDASGDVVVHETEVRRIRLADHQDASSLRDFAQTLASFIRDFSIDAIAVRRCTYKGKYVSGAAAIKMEALLQLSEVPVTLLSPQTIKAARKKSVVAAPAVLKGYQHDAFDAALTRAQSEG